MTFANAFDTERNIYTAHLSTEVEAEANPRGICQERDTAKHFDRVDLV